MVYKLQLVIASLKFLLILSSRHIFFSGINLLEKPWRSPIECSTF